MRIDKAGEVVRGVAGTAFAATGTAIGVIVGAGGSIIRSNGGTCDGILVPNANRGAYGTVTAAGERVDLLRRGEIVEFGGTAGDRIYAGTGGTLLANTAAGNKYVGVVMDGGERLVVGL